MLMSPRLTHSDCLQPIPLKQLVCKTAPLLSSLLSSSSPDRQTPIGNPILSLLFAPHRRRSPSRCSSPSISTLQPPPTSFALLLNAPSRCSHRRSLLSRNLFIISVSLGAAPGLLVILHFSSHFSWFCS